MKTNKFLAIVCGALLLLGSCTDKTEREPSPAFNGTSVAFEQPSLTIEQNPVKTGTTYDLTLTRSTKAGELTVEIINETPNDTLVIPSTVTFKDGEETATLTISFDKAEADVPYSTTISVPQAYQNPYAAGAVECAIQVTVAYWEDAPTQAVFVDGLVNAMYSIGAPAWYVSYQVKDNGDGTKDYRFINPYTVLPEYQGGDYDSPIADKYGVYGGFPSNYPTDVDSENAYPMIVHQSASGIYTYDEFDMGMEWNYGPFSSIMYADYKAKGGTPDYEKYGAGEYDSKDNVIMFPESVLVVIEGEYMNYNLSPLMIYLDATQYQNAHLSIADYNKVEMKPIKGVISRFKSSIFGIQSDDVVYGEAVDEAAGNPASPYLNLYLLKNVYNEGCSLAFYDEEGEITVPENQPLGVKIQGKELVIAEATGTKTISQVKGVNVTTIVFNIVVTTKDGAYVGEYEETFTFAKENIIFEKSDYIGNFVLGGKSQFGSDYPDAEMNVTISVLEEDTLILEGMDYAGQLLVVYMPENGSLWFTPQQTDSIEYEEELYQTIFFPTDLSGELTYEDPLEMAYDLDGTIKVTKDSKADGYALYVPSFDGWWDGYYELTLTPAAPSVSHRAQYAKHGLMHHSIAKRNKPTLTIQGPRHGYKRSNAKSL